MSSNGTKRRKLEQGGRSRYTGHQQKKRPACNRTIIHQLKPLADYPTGGDDNYRVITSKDISVCPQENWCDYNGRRYVLVFSVDLRDIYQLHRTVIVNNPKSPLFCALLGAEPDRDDYSEEVFENFTLHDDLGPFKAGTKVYKLKVNYLMSTVRVYLDRKTDVQILRLKMDLCPVVTDDQLE
jgi:hypothetical protein